MSVEAVGVYFDRLIALKGLKVKAVSEQAGVKPGYISRLISRGIKEPGASTLRAINDAVGGSWEHVGVLLQEKATTTQAKLLAEQWLHNSASPEQPLDAMHTLQGLVAELETDPRKIDQLLGYATRLRDES